MNAAGLIEQCDEDDARGTGLLGRIGRSRRRRRWQAEIVPAGTAPHVCQWRLLAYAWLPITEESPVASTLVIEGCRCCASVRSTVVAGRHAPGSCSDTLRVDREPAISPSVAPAPGEQGCGRS